MNKISLLIKDQRFLFSKKQVKEDPNINKSLRALSPTRQRKYSLNKNRLFMLIACTFQLVYLLSVESKRRRDAGATPFSRSWYSAILSALPDSGQRIGWRKEEKSSFETDRSLAYQMIVVQTGDPVEHDEDRLSCSFSIFPSLTFLRVKFNSKTKNIVNNFLNTLRLNIRFWAKPLFIFPSFLQVWCF